MLIAYVTCQDKQEAERLGRRAVSQRLAACANYFPIGSIFKWKDELEAGTEYVLLLKTKEKLRDELLREIKSVHSYETPCIIFIKPDYVNEEYLQWVRKSTK